MPKKPANKSAASKQIAELLDYASVLIKGYFPVEAIAYYQKKGSKQFSLMADHFVENTEIINKIIDLSDIELSFGDLAKESKPALFPYQVNKDKSDSKEIKILIASPVFTLNKLTGILVFLTLSESLSFGDSEQKQVIAVTGILQAAIESLNKKKATKSAQSTKNTKSTESPKPSVEKSASRLDLLDYSSQGFLLFDKACEIRPECFKILKSVFNKSPDGVNALNVLFSWGIPVNQNSACFDKSPDLEMIKGLLETVFLRVTDIDVILELFPLQVTVGKNCYAIKYSYIKSDKIEDDCILATFSDISEQKRLTDQLARETERKNMIVKVALDINGFIQLKKDLEQTFSLINNEVKKPVTEINLKSILNAINALEAGAEIYEMRDISERAVLIESYLNQLISDKTTPDDKNTNQIKIMTDSLSELFTDLQNQYLETLVSESRAQGSAVYQISELKINQVKNLILDRIINEGFQKAEKLFVKNYLPFSKSKKLEQLTFNRVDRVKTRIWEQIVPECQKLTEIIAEGLKKQPIGVLLKRYAVIAENLGKKLGKQVEVKTSGEELEISFPRFEELFSGLVHLIRNAVEHGLEKMEERVFLGKPLEGIIAIDADIDGNDNLTLKIADDGRGFDLEKIKQTAISKNPIDEKDSEQLTNEKTLEHVLDMGYTSKNAFSDTSIKGVGLEAVRVTVKELNGTFLIHSTPGEGTAITITIPLENS
ncbi:MAG: ATP-binding protein [Deltaproteobacteria bacterium]|nr:ATP-binding protein [Deltaproteobacteria bacterium]